MESRKGRLGMPIMLESSAAEWVDELDTSIAQWKDGAREFECMAIGDDDEMGED